VFKTIKRRRSLGIAVIAAAAIAAVGGYAFTAQNTVPAQKAGAGSGAITGYTVSNVAYTYDATGNSVTVVDFDLDAAATDVKIALTDTPVNADWQDCSGTTGTGPYHVTCTMGTPVDKADQQRLSVIAVDNGQTIVIGA
jgi:spermidine/putrescine-binding protein